MAVSKGVQATVEVIGAVIAAYFGQYQLAAALLSAAYSTERQARAEITARNAYNRSLRDRYAMSRTTTAPRALVYGRCRVSGPAFFITSYGPDRQNLVFCVALASHEIDAVEAVYFDDQLVSIDGSGNVSGVQLHESFSIAATSATVTVTKTPYLGSVTATARYGSTLINLTVSSVSGAAVTLTGALAGQTGQVDVYYQSNPDAFAPTSRSAHSDTFTIGSGSDTFTLTYAPDTTGVHAVYKATSSSSNDSTPVTVASVSGRNVTIAGGTIGRQVVIYYETSAGRGLARVRVHLGSAVQIADSQMVTELPGIWTSAHTATGVAYLVVECTYDQDAYIGGVPNVSAIIRGKRCYDPRTGVTAWTENPALHIRDLAMDPLGGRLPASQIDDVSIIAAANICDQTTSYVLGGQTYTRPLYTAGYQYTCDQKPMDGVADLCMAMGGDRVYADGMLRIWAGSYNTPIPLLLDETWLTDDQAVQVQPAPPRLSLVNSITATIADQYQAYRSVPLTPIAPPAYLAADGASLPQAVQYNAVTFAGQAQYISSCALRRDRQGLTLVVHCNMRAWQVQRFDVLPVTLSRFGWSNKPFEVIDDTWTADGGIQLTLKETAAEIWDMDAGFDASDIAPNTNMPVPWGLDFPGNLAAVSDDTTVMVQVDGTVIPRISVSWDAIGDSRVVQGGSVEVRYWRMGDSIDSFHSVKAQGSDTQVYLTDVTAGLGYLITARCTSVVTQSAWSPIFTIVAGGKTAAPSTVAGDGYTLGNGRVHLYWTPCTDVDYKLTEVRVGASWAAGTSISAKAADAFDWLQTTAGTYTLWFAHRNWSGYYGTPVSLSVVVDASVNVQAFIGYLSSSTYILPADSSGIVSSFTGATTTMTVSNLGADDTPHWTFSKADSTGVTSALSGTNGNILTVSAMTSAVDSGTVTITAARTGYASIVLVYTLAKSKSATATTGVNAALGNIGWEDDGLHPYSASITFKTDGTVQYYGAQWYLGTPGATYYIRFDQIGSLTGGATYSGSTLGTALTLTSDRLVQISKSAAGTGTGTFLYTITNASGVQLASGLVQLTVIAS